SYKVEDTVAVGDRGVPGAPGLPEGESPRDGVWANLRDRALLCGQPLVQAIRERWDRVSRAFLFLWGHIVPTLEDVARITGLRVDGKAVTAVTYADYTEFTQDLLGLEPSGADDLGDRRMVDRTDEESAGLTKAVYGQHPEDVERVDRDLRRFLVLFLGKMLLGMKGDDIHCRFLEIMVDLERVGQYAWGAAFLAHTFADLSSGPGREITVGRFAPFLQSYYYILLGMATELCPDALPLAWRWLPVVTAVSFSLQLDTLCRDIRDFPTLLVVWQPYAGMVDAGQPWVESGRPQFGRDLWVHCLNEIEPLRLRLAMRTLGLHQVWSEEVDNTFCKGSVDTTISGVDTMALSKGRNVKKRSSQVDTRSFQVDTRDLSQGIVLPVWNSVSTHLMGRSTHSGISVT
ncbi:hypothetical protein Taro_013131, partial [Colocasia esculenta]|nr:hypothetical protein [Colocasia esculenta]